MSSTASLCYIDFLPDDVWSLVCDIVNFQEALDLHHMRFKKSVRQIEMRTHIDSFKDTLRLIDKTDETNDDESYQRVGWFGGGDLKI